MSLPVAARFARISPYLSAAASSNGKEVNCVRRPVTSARLAARCAGALWNAPYISSASTTEQRKTLPGGAANTRGVTFDRAPYLR